MSNDIIAVGDPVENLIEEMYQGSISIELDPTMDNLAGLEHYEGVVDSSVKDEIFARTTRAYACYTILEHKLYRHRTAPVCALCWAEGVENVVNADKPSCPVHGPCQVENACIYHNDKEYLNELKRRVGRSVSTIKDYKQALRLAAANFGHNTIEQVLAYGGVDTYLAIKEESIIDPKTAKIKAMRNGNPNGKEAAQFAREKLEEMGPLEPGDDATDWRYRIKNALQTRQVRIWFQVDRKKRETIWHKEVVEDGSPTHYSGNVFDPDIPADVWEYYGKRLNCEVEPLEQEIIEL